MHLKRRYCIWKDVIVFEIIYTVYQSISNYSFAWSIINIYILFHVLAYIIHVFFSRNNMKYKDRSEWIKYQVSKESRCDQTSILFRQKHFFPTQCVFIVLPYLFSSQVYALFRFLFTIHLEVNYTNTSNTSNLAKFLAAHPATEVF